MDITTVWPVLEKLLCRKEEEENNSSPVVKPVQKGTRGTDLPTIQEEDSSMLQPKTYKPAYKC